VRCSEIVLGGSLFPGLTSATGNVMTETDANNEIGVVLTVESTDRTGAFVDSIHKLIFMQFLYKIL
jgi:hypothetical protein